MLGWSRETGWLVLPLIAAHAALLFLFDLGRQPGATLFVLLLAFLAWLRAVTVLEQRGTLTLPLLLGVAALLRLLLIPLPPTLSDDTLRYVWDGRVVAAGFDPYQLAPEAEALSALRDPLWEKMPHHEVPTVYPPLALALFALAGKLPLPLVAVKILLSLFDLLGCLGLYRLAIHLGLPVARVLFYAWNPLVVLETAGMGHVDALMASFSIVAVLLLARGQTARAGLAAAAAVLAKLLPLLALPLWLRRSQRPWIFAAATGAALATAFLPVVLGSGGVPRGLRIYGARWEFNGPLFEPLWRLIDLLDLVGVVKAGLDGLKGLTGWHEALNALYPLVYPQLLAKICLGLLLLGGLCRLFLDRPEPAIGIGRAMAAFLLCTATFYPWYAIAILPWAALYRRRAFLLLSGLLPLSYLPQLVPGLALFPWVFLAIWLPFWLLFLREGKWSPG